MLKIKYISMQVDVFSRLLGGYSHFKGVSKTLASLSDLSVVGNDLDKLDLTNVNKKEVGANWYYTSLLWDYMSDYKSDVILVRKTLIGSLLFSIAFLPKKLILQLLGKNQILIYEYNGISGEFNKSLPKILKYVLSSLNVIPTVLSDGTYCVNEFIKGRLINKINGKKLFVCENGGPEALSAKVQRGYQSSSFGILFFGGKQDHYDVDTLIEFINSKASELDIQLYLVGPGLKTYESKNIVCPGAMSLEELDILITKQKRLMFGAVPLRKILPDNKARPIKVFDYMALGIPIVHTVFCLEGFDKDRTFSYPYTTASDLQTLFEHIDVDLYQESSEKVVNAYRQYEWTATLTPLIKFIESNVKV